MSFSCIIDASVFVQLFINDRHTLKIRAFFADMESNTYHAPDAVYYETMGTLRKHELRFGYTTFHEDIRFMLDIPLVIVPTSNLLLLAADICRMHLISPYDAFYVALSQREGLPLLTADERLVHATYSKGFDVRFVGNTLL